MDDLFFIYHVICHTLTAFVEMELADAAPSDAGFICVVLWIVAFTVVSDFYPRAGFQSSGV